ncbi:MAP7 domain-containing protein 1 [Brassica rapa]|uniref:Uncharacterized protein n=1 Tax=Brassica campestris TaxID=3711 RepID=A0A3P6C2N6_BRACM|nr:MAP7 domain-containing protein 1 [Brassica rapa]CAG7904656.1 unnamed protein product [Brassica rapa]VDD02149.1 unnamed protein product [Brassica rapa]
MPPFRFNIPFFSYGSPSRPSSSGTSSPSPPPPPPTSSRPPFRPGGIAHPSKPATSQETKPKVSPSLSRSKSNVAATAASSSASQLPSRGAATPSRLAKQSNQSGSPVKKPESLRAEEQKVAMKDKSSREVRKEAGENSNPVVEKPPAARSEQEEAQEQRRREVEKLAVVDRDSKTAQGQQKSKETEKLTPEEKKKGLSEDMEERTKTAQEQQKSKETEKLAVEEKKKGFQKDTEEKTKTAQETEKLAMEEKEKVLQDHMEENSKTSQEQQRRKETEKLAAQEKKKVLHKDMEENSKAAQEQQKSKLAVQERHTALKTVGTEDATQSKTTQNITAAKEGSSSMSRKIKEDIRDGLSKLTWGKSNGDNEKSVSVFTLTGENRGANMAIGSEKDKKDGEVHIRRGYKTNPDESPETTATETEGGTRPYPKDVEEDARVRAYVNGNSQGVNNSIICDSSVQQNDPGIHMNLRFEKSKEKDETISPPEKKPATEKVLKYEPRVRRRCLRGLLAESSQSDPENPLKPRRHGCRFTCKDKDIENT